MGRYFNPLQDSSDNPQPGSTSTPQLESPFWSDAYASLGPSGGGFLANPNANGQEIDPQLLQQLQTGIANLLSGASRGQQGDLPQDTREALLALLQTLRSGRSQLQEDQPDRPQERPNPQQLQQRMRELIRDLMSDQPAVRQAAETELQGMGRDALPFLQQVLRYVPSQELRQSLERIVLNILGPNNETMLGLINDLGSDQYQVRQNATRDILERFGTLALPFLRRVLQNPPSEEVRQRVEAIIANIMGANNQTWDGTIARDGSGRITGVRYSDIDLAHTQVQWNGQNQINQLWMHNPYDPTGDLTMQDFGFQGLHFIRTANGYQVTRLDGGPLPDFMQTARDVRINEDGVITVVWSNGGENEFHPVSNFFRLNRNLIQ